MCYCFSGSRLLKKGPGERPEGSSAIALSWRRLALPVVNASSQVLMKEPRSDVSPFRVMGRALPGAARECSAVNATCSHMSCTYPGDACQIGATEINKGPAEKGRRKEGTWRAAKSSFYSRDKAKSLAVPTPHWDGPTLFNCLRTTPMDTWYNVTGNHGPEHGRCR